MSVIWKTDWTDTSISATHKPKGRNTIMNCGLESLPMWKVKQKKRINYLKLYLIPNRRREIKISCERSDELEWKWSKLKYQLLSNVAKLPVLMGSESWWKKCKSTLTVSIKILKKLFVQCEFTCPQKHTRYTVYRNYKNVNPATGREHLCLRHWFTGLPAVLTHTVLSLVVLLCTNRKLNPNKPYTLFMMQ